jgi:hypothetical protein
MSSRKTFAATFGSLALGALAACSSSEPAPARPAADPARASEDAPVETASTTRSSRPREDRPRDDRPSADRSGSRDGDAVSARARRERVIEDASEEDRPAGRSEARFEPDGASYKPGIGLLPRYTLRTIDRTGDPAPDPILERAVPGSKIDLPPPEKPAPVAVKKAETPDDERPVKPKPVD